MMDKALIRQQARFERNAVFLLQLNRRRNDMRPKRYPYSKPQWETEVSNVYADGYPEPYATFVTHTNRLTGEVK